MNRTRVNCLKGVVTFLNFICWLCGAFIVGFGEFQMMRSRFGSLITSFWPLYPANTLTITGTIVTCVCYLGIMGALKENRCMLITIDTFFEKDLMRSLETYKNSTSEGNLTIKEDFDVVQHIFRCCGVHGVADWEGNFICMCFTVPIFCQFSRNGYGYKSGSTSGNGSKLPQVFEIHHICGTAVFGFGVFMMLNSKVSALIPTLYSLNLSNTLLITGIIMTCVSFLGFLGALKENRCLLITFFILLLILMLVELTVACLLLVYETEIDSFLKKDLTDSLKMSRDSAKGGNSTMNTDDWDIIQTTFQCCGVNNASDWKDKAPMSCCSKSPCDIKHPVYWEAGCYDKLSEWFGENFLATGVGVIVLCIIEVLGMCFSMTLFCHISRSGLAYKL
ncbi:unnamed protein product [Coregonus sp. 'balchen']|nr:unnamed protein product [Coregonus sp. 'balchen']